MKYALILMAALMAIPAAQADRFYGPNGSNVGRAERSGNTTRYYDRSGSYSGSATESGNDTRYYNRNGSYAGSRSR